MSSFDSIGRIAGPVYGGQVYLFNQTYPYLTGALILAAVLAATLMIFKKTDLEELQQS